MSPDDVTKGDAPFISYVPWSVVGNSDSNLNLLKWFCHGVFSYIMANPGVTKVIQKKNFFFSLLQETLFICFKGHLRIAFLSTVTAKTTSRSTKCEF